MATLHDSKSATAFYSLGVVHFRLQEFQFAVESLEESNRLYPDYAQTHFFLAQAKAGLELAPDWEEVQEQLDLVQKAKE